IAPAWMSLSVELPLASMTRRLDRPWVYSWYSTLASNAELVGTYGPPVTGSSLVPGMCHRYICMVGGMPSGGVLMLALSMWLPSGRPALVLAPSSALSRTGSPPEKEKLPAPLVKPIGLLAR